MRPARPTRRSLLTYLALGGVSLACDRPTPKRAAGAPPSTAPRSPAPRSAATAPTIEAEPLPPPASSAEPEPEAEPRPIYPAIHLQPLGEKFSGEDLDFIISTLGVFFPHPVQIRTTRALPDYAYYRPRSRYRAEKLLLQLQDLFHQGSQVIVGLTTVDISTTKGPHEDWGILGLATIGGHECVISKFRAHRNARDERHVRIRLAKTVVHEVGHTLGLEHCPHHGCLMEDGKGTVLTTDHEYDFCDACRAQVGEQLKPRTAGSIPWENPGIRWPMP